jgi:hypothetical protein
MVGTAEHVPEVQYSLHQHCCDTTVFNKIITFLLEVLGMIILLFLERGKVIGEEDSYLNALETIIERQVVKELIFIL